MRPIDYFDRGAAAHPEKTFVAGGDNAISFAEAQESTRQIAKALYHAGFQIGDSVAVYSPNDAGAVVCIFAAYRAGGAWVPVNVRNAASTNAEYMSYVKTQWLFFHSSVLAETEAVIPHLKDLKGVICFDSDDTPHPSLQSFIDAGSAAEVPDWNDPFGSPDVIFSRWPTGGTTGPSKGVEISNRAATAMIEQGLKCYVGDREENIVHLAVAPITHAAGVVIGTYATVGGSTIVLPNFDARTVLETIQKEQVTHIFLPPTAYYALLDEAKNRHYDTGSLRQVLIAAAPVSPDKFREGVAVFGPVICQCYGQAEAPMLISWLSPKIVAAAADGEHPERLKSAGQVTSCTQVGIIDEAGNLMPIGERGEICCRGPLVTPGYFEKPEATQEARKYGWHHTGDIGYLDEHNYLYIVDGL
ncbi:MAG: AMP-binding protein [Pseudomonadota bacterium]